MPRPNPYLNSNRPQMAGRGYQITPVIRNPGLPAKSFREFQNEFFREVRVRDWVQQNPEIEDQPNEGLFHPLLSRELRFFFALVLLGTFGFSDNNQRRQFCINSLSVGNYFFAPDGVLPSFQILSFPRWQWVVIRGTSNLDHVIGELGGALQIYPDDFLDSAKRGTYQYFADRGNSLAESVLGRVEFVRTKLTFICGHSLGGGILPTVYRRLVREGVPVGNCIGIAPPRSVLWRQITNGTLPSYRFENLIHELDPVPTVPFSTSDVPALSFTDYLRIPITNYRLERLYTPGESIFMRGSSDNQVSQSPIRTRPIDPIFASAGPVNLINYHPINAYFRNFSSLIDFSRINHSWGRLREDLIRLAGI